VLSAEIVLAVPYSAAPQLQNTAAVAGKVVVVQRGGSTFQEKATQAQVAGAVGVIIVNNVADDPSRLVVMNITATVGIAIKIPVGMVSQSVEAALQASQGLRITIRPTPQSPVGKSASPLVALIGTDCRQTHAALCLHLQAHRRCRRLRRQSRARARSPMGK
jgi:fructose-specific phosphotransferase system component IIB